MADKIATDFISDMKAKGRKALDWFKKIVTKTQRAATPASFGRKEILNEQLTFTKIGWVYHFNAIPDQLDGYDKTEYWMKRTYEALYE